MITQVTSSVPPAWITSLSTLRVGRTPLAAPASGIVFSLHEDSLGATFRFLRNGGTLSLASGENPRSIADQWQWFLSNLDDDLCLGVGVGYVVHPEGNFRFPLFTGFLAADFTTPPAHLLLDGSLELNNALVQLLAKQFGVNPIWVRQGKTAAGINLEAMWEALQSQIRATRSAGKLVLEREVRVGLVSPANTSIRQDLEQNQLLYLQRPLVAQYASQKGKVSWQQHFSPVNPVTDGTLAPLRADYQQLQVPQLFAQGHSFIVSGLPVTGKTTAVANALATALAAGKTTLIVGSADSLAQLRARTAEAGFDHLFLTLGALRTDRAAQQILQRAWDNPVNADEGYWQSCRQSLASLSQDLDSYVRQIHDPGPHQLSAWSAFSAQLLTGDELNPVEKQLARQLADSHNFPYLTSDRAQAAKLGAQLAQLDAHSVTGLAANPWSLAGATEIDRSVLVTAVDSLEKAISQAHPAVLEIMSACSHLATWPVFSRWLQVLEKGYGRAPVELTDKERHAVTTSISALRVSLEELLAEAAPVLELAAEAYRQGRDLDLLTDARHAEASSGLSRNGRRKAILAQLRPFLSRDIPVAEVSDLLENMSLLRVKAEALGMRINAAKILGLRDFDPLQEGAASRFNLHADTILTAIDLAKDLPGRQADLESLIPIAREGGQLGLQVKQIAQAFAVVLDTLRSTQSQLDAWSAGIPPLGKYLQVRKMWLSSLATPDSTLDDMMTFRQLAPQLSKIGLDDLLQLVVSGTLKGKSIQAVLEHALALAAVDERRRSLEQQGFSGQAHQAQVERLTATAAETRREIQNMVRARAMDFSSGTDKDQLRDFGAALRATDFSVAAALRDHLPALLCRTPLLGLTPQQVATYFDASAQPLFDAVVILDSAQLPVGAVVKSLALSQQVLWTATTPASRTYGDTGNAYQAAQQAGFPELELRVRYGQELSSTPSAMSQVTGAGLLNWPIAHGERRPIHNIILPSASPVNDWNSAQELPGWSGVGAAELWYERAGNFLVNLCAKNKSARIKAVTWTTELALGIRSYLEALCATNPVNLSNLDLTHLGALRATAQTDVLVFFIGAEPAPAVISAVTRSEFNESFTRLLLSANRVVILAENQDTDRSSLPRLLRDVLEPLPASGVNTLDSQPDVVTKYLATLLSRAGLEVRTELGDTPLRVDLAVRGDSRAPWLGLFLDTPAWCQIPDALDREVNLGQYLVTQCGFGAVDHIFLTDLMFDPDEVTRRLVSIALDLAFPGEIADGAVAEDDRYTTPANIAAAQSKRQAETMVIPDVAAPPPPPPSSVKPTLKSAGSADESLRDRKSLGTLAVPTRKTPDSLAAPDTRPAPVSLAPGSSVTGSSHLPTVLTDSDFTHLSKSEIETPQAPSLAQELAQDQTEWVMDLAEWAPPVGKINQPGEGDFSFLEFPAPDFAPAVAAEAETDTAGTATKQSSLPQLHETTMPAPVLRIENDFSAAGITPLDPVGVAIQNLGQKEQLDNLDAPENAAAVAAALGQILRQEGPVGAERLAKLVADAFGMQRLHPKRRKNLLALLPATVQCEITEFGEFLWPENLHPESYSAFRSGSVYGPRPITAIPDTEFNNALTWVIETEKPLEEDTSELVAQALDLGPARTMMRQRMKAGLAVLQATGRLVSENGRYSLK